MGARGKRGVVLMAQWWVVNHISRPGGPRGPQQTNYVIEESATRPVNTIAGPFASKADAQAWQTSANTAGNSPGSAIGGAADAAGLGGISGFLSRLASANTWVRVGEVVIGLILLGIGLNAMLKGKPMQVVTGAAGTVGKAAIL